MMSRKMLQIWINCLGVSEVPASAEHPKTEFAGAFCSNHFLKSEIAVCRYN